MGERIVAEMSRTLRMGTEQFDGGHRKGWQARTGRDVKYGVRAAFCVGRIRSRALRIITLQRTTMATVSSRRVLTRLAMLSN